MTGLKIAGLKTSGKIERLENAELKISEN